MHLTSLFKILLVDVFALACSLEGGNAVSAGVTERSIDKIRAVQKIVEETFPGGTASLSSDKDAISTASSSFSLSSTVPQVLDGVTMKIEVSSNFETENELGGSAGTAQSTSTSTSTSSTATIATASASGSRLNSSSAANNKARARLQSLKDESALYSAKIKSSHNEFLARQITHEAFMAQNLNLINQTLSSIAVSAELELNFITELFFLPPRQNTSFDSANLNRRNDNREIKIPITLSKDSLKKLADHLNSHIGDNQQIDLSAILRSLKQVRAVLAEMEEEMDGWEAYLRVVEKELVSTQDEVLRLGDEIEGLMSRYEDDALEELKVGSVTGAFVRVKSWLIKNANGDENEKEEIVEGKGQVQKEKKRPELRT